MEKISTGVSGLDEILFGGYVKERAFLVRGGPGTGKTTLGLHFLSEGALKGEKSLFLTLGQTEEQIREDARNIGFEPEGIEFLDLSPSSDVFKEGKSYTLFSPSEVDREPLSRKIVAKIEEIRPDRLFMDVVTQFRYLAIDDYQFRSQIFAFLRFLKEKKTTILFSTERDSETSDKDLVYIADGVIQLDQLPEGRSLNVIKSRASDFRPGPHAMKLTGRGMEVFPRLMPELHKREPLHDKIPSGVPELDEMLQGGLERGTVTIVTGPSGVGKTTFGLQFMKEAAERGERSVVYSFEEELETTLERCEALNIPARSMIEGGNLSLVKIDPLSMSPDEFAQMVREEVEKRGARIVMLDGVSGYRLSLQGKDLTAHLHSLCKYLQNMGVAAILINEVELIVGEFRITENQISFLSDNVVFIRYVEKILSGGSIEMRKIIGILKKRLSDFDKSAREYTLTSKGIEVGGPMKGLSSIFGTLPVWTSPSLRED